MASRRCQSLLVRATPICHGGPCEPPTDRQGSRVCVCPARVELPPDQWSPFKWRVTKVCRIVPHSRMHGMLPENSARKSVPISNPRWFGIYELAAKPPPSPGSVPRRGRRHRSLTCMFPRRLGRSTAPGGGSPTRSGSVGGSSGIYLPERQRYILPTGSDRVDTGLVELKSQRTRIRMTAQEIRP